MHLTQDFEHVNVKSFNLKSRFINSTLSDIKNCANKNARLDDNQTSVVSSSRINERNEKAGANPVKPCY